MPGYHIQYFSWTDSKLIPCYSLFIHEALKIFDF
jgi:hypothetical protein